MSIKFMSTYMCDCEVLCIYRSSIVSAARVSCLSKRISYISLPFSTNGLNSFLLPSKN